MHIRWLVKNDMPQVMAIERASFEVPWSEADFVRTLRTTNSIGQVCEVDRRVVGYMIYGFRPRELQLWNLAVAPLARRQGLDTRVGVGTALVQKLIDKLGIAKPGYERRSRLVVDVRESNLAAQLFFKSCGLRAVKVIRNFYRDIAEDVYRFEYRLPTGEFREPAANRISGIPF